MSRQRRRSSMIDLAFHADEPRDPLTGKWTAAESAAMKFWDSKHGGVRRIQHGQVGEAFDSAARKLPLVSAPVYRGVQGHGADAHAALNVGDKVSWDEPRSTSTDIHQAFSYGTNIYQIEGSPARLLGKKSVYAYEKEAILPPGDFEVTHRESRKLYGYPVNVLHLRDITQGPRTYRPRHNADLASHDGHHVPGTPDTYKHGWVRLDALPLEPGKTKIPKGTIRVFHYTSEDNAESIARSGILRSYAHGDSGLGPDREPSAGVWVSTGRGAGMERNKPAPHQVLVEGYITPDQISRQAEYPPTGTSPEEFGKDYHHIILKGDLPPDQIVAIHQPWHVHARYIQKYHPDWQNEYGSDEIARMPPDYKKAFAYLRQKKTTDLAFHDHEPRDPLTGRWVHLTTTSGGGYQSHTVALVDHENNPKALVSWSNYGKNAGAIDALYVDPAYRRKGLATLAYAKAKQIAPTLKHSAERSDVGDAFVRSVGDHFPRRRKIESTQDADDLGKQVADRVKSQLNGEGFYIRPKVVDLARPAEQVHTVQPPPQDDKTVRVVAAALLAAGTVTAAVAAVSAILAPYGISAQAVRMAIDLTHIEGGTSVRPNARLVGHAVTATTPSIRTTRDGEAYYRAAYVMNAAHRIMRDLKDGQTPKEALAAERPLYLLHEKARRGRLDAASQVQSAANMFGWPEDQGTLVGWYLNPLLNNEVECEAANGHNFYAEEGTIIGLPGAVHANCGCYAGPPHEGATLVNEALQNVVKFQPRPVTYKLRRSRSA